MTKEDADKIRAAFKRTHETSGGAAIKAAIAFDDLLKQICLRDGRGSTSTGRWRDTDRSGRRVRIYAEDGSGKYPIHGAAYGHKGWTPFSWNRDGKLYACTEQSASDLMPADTRSDADDLIPDQTELQADYTRIAQERDEAKERAQKAEALLQRAYHRLSDAGSLWQDICNHMNRYAGARP